MCNLTAVKVAVFRIKCHIYFTNVALDMRFLPGLSWCGIGNLVSGSPEGSVSAVKFGNVKPCTVAEIIELVDKERRSFIPDRFSCAKIPPKPSITPVIIVITSEEIVSQSVSCA